MILKEHACTPSKLLERCFLFVILLLYLLGPDTLYFPLRGSEKLRIYHGNWAQRK
jgi:hypothetical protein